MASPHKDINQRIGEAFALGGTLNEGRTTVRKKCVISQGHIIAWRNTGQDTVSISHYGFPTPAFVNLLNAILKNLYYFNLIITKYQVRVHKGVAQFGTYRADSPDGWDWINMIDNAVMTFPIMDLDY